MKKIFSTIFNISEFLIIYLLNLIVVSTLIGSICSFLTLKWKIVTVIVCCLISVITSITIYKIHIFRIENIKEFVVLCIITVVAIFIYHNYSPSISIQQDQSVYASKALFLVNYGTLSKPISLYTELNNDGIIDTNGELKNYGAFENGMEFRDGNLMTDFYPGAAYFCALLGIFRKIYVFWGQAFITIANVLLLFFIIKSLIVDKYKLETMLYVLSFMCTPICVWFGRSSSTENIALFGFLLVTFLFLNINEKIEYILAFVLPFCLSTRIDYFILAGIGIILITMRSKLRGFFSLLTVVGYSYVLKYVFYIYYNRICFRDMKIVKYQVVIFILCFVIGIIVNKYLSKCVDFIYASKGLKYLVFLWGVVINLLVLRDSLTREENYGRFTEFGLDIRSYVECVMDNLYLVFPSLVIVFGLLGAFVILKNKKVNMYAGIFFMIMTAVASYFVYYSSNAPQMYFLLRRYFNIFLPAVLILFLIAVNAYIGNYKARIVISAACLLMSLNLFGNSKQHVEYDGIVQSVQRFEECYDEDDTVIVYNQVFKYDFSPIVAYSKYEAVPIQTDDELINLYKTIENYSKKNIIFLSTSPIEGIDYDNTVYFDYYRMGENYEELPKDYYHNEATIYIYDTETIKASIGI